MLEDDNLSPLAAMRQATVFACIQVRGMGFAQLSPKIFRKLPNGDREEAPNHWAWRLWREAPGADWNPFEFAERLSNDLDCHGNFYALKVKKGETITELVPLDPKAVTAKRNASTRRIEYKIDGYSVRGKETLTRDDIFHVRRMSRDGVTGLSPITECRLCISTVISAEQHGRSTFKNGAHPSGVLEYPETLDDAEYDRLQKDFDDNWNGKKAGRTLILEGGAKFQPINISNKDAQFLETRQFGRSEICGIFRVPPHKVGDLSRSTNNNIEHQGIEWSTEGLLPEACRTEAAWNSSPEMAGTGYYLEFNLDSLIRGDFRTRMEGYGKAISSAIMSPNEVRKKENLPSDPNGNQLMMMANVVSLERAVAGGAIAAGVAPVADEEDPAMPEEETNPDAL